MRVVVVSVEGPDDARQTQAEFPHLLVLSDVGHGLSDAAGFIDTENKGPDGGAVDAPTTVLVDRQGVVRWLFRPGAVITRLSPDEVLQAIDQRMRVQP